MPAVTDYGLPQDQVESAEVETAFSKPSDDQSTALPSELNTSELDEATGALTTLPADATAELAKWRARVPKLAAALKQRAAEVESLQKQLASTEDRDVSIRVRQQQIQELEKKYAALNQRYQTTAGELRSRELELTETKEEAVSWKISCQDVTQSLDEQVDLLQQSQTRQQLLELEIEQMKAKTTQQADEIHNLRGDNSQLREELSGQENRNSKLLESVELANRQIHSLGEDLTGLQEKRKHSEAQVEELQTNQVELQNQIVERRGRVLELQENLAAQHSRVTEAEQHAALMNQTITALQAQLEAEKQHALLDVAQIQAEHSQQLRDVHAQTLLVFEAVDEQWANDMHVSLEQSRTTLLQSQTTVAQLQTTVLDLEAAIAQLEVTSDATESRLAQANSERDELAQTQEELRRELAAAGCRLANLRTTRTDATTAQRFALAATVESLEVTLATLPEKAPQDDEVAELREQIQALQQALADVPAPSFQAHELTRLKGVGEKTAEQLCALGFDSLQSVAQLKRDVLSSPIHPLHSLRSRIVNDNWIEQAQDLLPDLSN